MHRIGGTIPKWWKQEKKKGKTENGMDDANRNKEQNKI